MAKFAVIAVWFATCGELCASTLRGIVTDAANAPAPSAVVELSHISSGFTRRTVAGLDGSFLIGDVPEGHYRLRVSLPGFRTHSTAVTVTGSSSLELQIQLALADLRTTLTVAAPAGTIVENRITASETFDSSLIGTLPALSPDSGLNDAILFTTPGVAADSNGLFHPLGDHAQVSYILDGQPISDQRNKVFSTSIPANAIETMEVISGSPAAEFGDKTSLVINATTRSGLGKAPTGSLLAGYGSFGTVLEEGTLGIGTARWGNFLVVNAERTGRFLDTPEFWPAHDTGNTAAFFDRLDFQPGGKDALHLNLMGARNWIQVPNTYDHPRQDQRQKVLSFNTAAGWQHTFDAHTLAGLNLFFRRDHVRYYPSRDPLDDSPATMAQNRSLANFGVRADLARVRGRHNWKVGLSAVETRLDEEFRLGITDPAYNPPEDPAFLPSLLPYDLSRGGSPFEFLGRARIRQAALFAQDAITLGNLTLSTGLRFDRYRGISQADGIQPRVAFSYLIRPTRTSIRSGFSHTLETPTTENLTASNSTGSGGLASNLFTGTADQRPIVPGSRNQYDAGIEQALGSWVRVDVSYFRKYTRNAFDFDALFSTPITFPIGWKQSKLDGVSARVSTREWHGLCAYATMGHANARFFGPEVGGIIFNSNLSVGAYRQDHDQVYQQNVNLHYQRAKNGWWADFTWRYDSGLVVGAVNTLQDVLDLTAAQQAAIGFYCGGEEASAVHHIASCAGQRYGASRIRIPTPGTDDPDHNPPRTVSRHILNVGTGTDNLFHTERLRTVVRITVLNLGNQAALYNFLSPFSGTHWVQPRSYQAQIGWAF
jgi:hypothetical protein